MTADREPCAGGAAAQPPAPRAQPEAEGTSPLFGSDARRPNPFVFTNKKPADPTSYLDNVPAGAGLTHLVQEADSVHLRWKMTSALLRRKTCPGAKTAILLAFA
jgi:hypothetical protein